MSFKKPPDDDKIYCKSIAKSISDIIRFSLNEEFRKKCFDIFKVSSTKETEREIKNRLIALINNEKRDFPKSQGGVSNIREQSHERKDKEKENTDAESNDQNLEAIVSTPSTTILGNSQSTPENIFKRNWLEISSQQYGKIIKRRKLNYYSQPQFSQEHSINSEPYSCRTYSSDSQPSSSTSILNEGKMSFSEPLGDTTNYFREKFKDLFRDNAEKYFRSNLKSQRLQSESSKITRKFSF